jgi:hypothetical protein
MKIPNAPALPHLLLMIISAGCNFPDVAFKTILPG